MTLPPLDLSKVQGDLLAGLPKKTETFFFFQIDDPFFFRVQLAQLVPLITPAAQVLTDRVRIARYKAEPAQINGNQAPLKSDLLPLSGINVAFSQFGLTKMGIGKVDTDPIGDPAFEKGMLADAANLGDQVSTNWLPEFQEPIDGVLLVTANDHTTANARMTEVKAIFSVGQNTASIHEVLTLVGDVRPGTESAHEHFGFLDSISQPAVEGVGPAPNPGQQVVRQGTILCGRLGDNPIKLDPTGKPLSATRPSWALDGSFLVFRHLPQLVPEFNEFLRNNALRIPDPSAPPGLGAELLGARLIGRWKSGAPIDLTPIRDDPTLGGDPSQNNNFRYVIGDDQASQERCPFAAHTRKTNPRGDLDAVVKNNPHFLESHRIIRHGIQFGPEVTQDEFNSSNTILERGLNFVSYQSSIVDGFQFIQQSWANNDKFPFGKPNRPVPGFDAIIGQSSDPTVVRSLSGTDPTDPDDPSASNSLTLTQEWVIAKGGEYFFSPSLTSLQSTFAVSNQPPPP